MARWTYEGDVNVENGGVWYRIDARDWDEYGYCDAVRVTPCADAGAQGNAWWVEELTVLRPDTEEKMRSVLEPRGLALANGAIVSTYGGGVVARKGTAAYRRAIAECCVGYGKYDVGRSETVQIGKEPEESDEHPAAPDVVLRRGSSLERHVRREWLATV